MASIELGRMNGRSVVCLKSVIQTQRYWSSANTTFPHACSFVKLICFQNFDKLKCDKQSRMSHGCTTTDKLHVLKLLRQPSWL